MTRLLSIAVLAAALAACADDSDKPWVEFAGGGFIYNYRLATAEYGFVLRRVRKLPDGTIIEAEFEDPAGGPPIVQRQTAEWTRPSWKFETPPVQGIRAGRDYRVEVRLIDPVTDQVFARYAKSFHADVDQDILPRTPPVLGPGYQPNPAAD